MALDAMVLAEAFSRTVFIIVKPDGEPWETRCFPTPQRAVDAVRAEQLLYWPQLVSLGWRVQAATLRWGV